MRRYWAMVAGVLTLFTVLFVVVEALGIPTVLSLAGVWAPLCSGSVSVVVAARRSTGSCRPRSAAGRTNCSTDGAFSLSW